MGAASENRYAAFAARQATCNNPTLTELFVRDLNLVPKDKRAMVPFGDILFVASHGGWFAECPVTGYGFWYKTVREAVSAWHVAVFLDGGNIIGQPIL